MFIDVTHRLSNRLPTYPGNPPFRLEPVLRQEDGAAANVSLLHVGTHAGTHVDAPSHFFPGGTSVDELPLEVMVGPARLLHVPVLRGLTPDDLAAVQPGDHRVLIRTANDGLWNSPDFSREYAFLTEAAAKFLVEAGIRLVGLDYLSVEQFKKPGAPAHHVLLGAGVVIIEGLDLRLAGPGVYDMTCLPLPVEGGDGAPARVILRTP